MKINKIMPLSECRPLMHYTTQSRLYGYTFSNNVRVPSDNIFFVSSRAEFHQRHLRRAGEPAPSLPPAPPGGAPSCSELLASREEVLTEWSSGRTTWSPANTQPYREHELGVREIERVRDLGTSSAPLAPTK